MAPGDGRESAGAPAVRAAADRDPEQGPDRAGHAPSAAELLNEYNHVFTENVYNVGLVTIPAALIVNKRFKDVPAGAPVLAYQWSEDNTLRERMWIAKEDQAQVPELMPGILPHVT